MITYRQLPTSDYHLLLPVYDEQGEPLPIPDETVAYVAEHDDRLIGCITGQRVVCVSLLYVDKRYRGDGVAEQLAQGGYQLLPPLQKMMITTNPFIDRLAHLMGFIPKVGQLWTELPGGK